MGERLIAGGSRVQVLFNGQPVGLATGASYDEDWAVTPANVLNFLGPIDYDSQGYSCSLNMSTFIPEIPGGGPFPDGGLKALADYLPTRSQVQGTGKPGEIDSVQFVNTSTGEIVNQFRNVMIASNGTQINPNSYISTNVRMMAVEREI